MPKTVPLVIEWYTMHTCCCGYYNARDRGVFDRA